MRRPLLRSERGAAAVEFSIVATLLLMLLFGLLLYGFVFGLKHTMTHAASEGARAANAAPVGSEVIAAEERARNALSWQKARDHAVIDAQILDPCDATAGVRCIHVAITYDWQAHPIVPSVFGVGAPKTVRTEAKLIID